MSLYSERGVGTDADGFGVHRFLESADGLVTRRALEVDGEHMLSALSTWVGQTRNRPTFHLGPLIPFEPATCTFSQASLNAEMASAPGEIGARTLRFLDEALRRRGECSVVYISFGTVSWFAYFLSRFWEMLTGGCVGRRILSICAFCFVLWSEKLCLSRVFVLHSPPNPAHVGLAAQILSHSSSEARIPDDLKAHFEGSDTGLFSSWSPQQAILAHKVSSQHLSIIQHPNRACRPAGGS